ncbi:DUF1800 family protein [Microbulbifer sp. ALW1]|uniref:DUF1800 domain-containing protein n=1 Tax=Microbulbifer sp. (strain ALW1) TaxID=1516059 RepID=UPI00135C5664|nr:DUF1800 domain-containing protein [Microbulbifer sp. ALW1]
MDKVIYAVTATQRFGYGALPGQISEAEKSPRRWLIEQLSPAALPKADYDANYFLTHFFALQKKARQLKESQQRLPKEEYASLNQIALHLAADNIRAAITARDSINYRLLEFFSNHFSISHEGRLLGYLAPVYEREVIAPNMLANFDQLLTAAVLHPAMLKYLDNDISFGPDSLAGRRRHKGLNENLAREVLELHTLGVNGGYGQQDVIELAKALTGWTISRGQGGSNAGSFFRTKAHQPGPKTIMRKTYREVDEQQIREILRDLAIHPATANHISTKLARHFVTDNPPKSLVAKMTARWLDTGGNLRSVITTMIEGDESWSPAAAKLKTPRDFLISSYRALEIDSQNIPDKRLIHLLTRLGQKPYGAHSPAGWGDTQQDWSGAAALASKINWAYGLAKYSRRDINAVIEATYGDSLSDHTRETINRADSQHQALTLFLLSPEFLRRA